MVVAAGETELRAVFHQVDYRKAARKPGGMLELVTRTGWKMNNGMADSIRYAEELGRASPDSAPRRSMALLFTSLGTAANAPVRRWRLGRACTGTIPAAGRARSMASMLLEAGCATSTWRIPDACSISGKPASGAAQGGQGHVRRSDPDRLLGRKPAQEKADGRSDEVLADQVFDLD